MLSFIKSKSIYAVLLASFSPFSYSKGEVIVYSSRKAHLIEPALKAFTKETGINVINHQGKAGALIEKISAEGKSTKADLLITVDGGNLWNAANKGLFEPVDSKVLKSNIPANLRDPKNLWFGLSLRARTVVYNKKLVKNPSSIESYENLASPNWKKKVCLRTSKKVYNQSLVAMLVHNHNLKNAETIVKGWVDNLATDVFSNDTKVIQAVAAGKCHVGIVNTYYFGRLQKKDPQLNAALYWPNQKDDGVHVNVSGAGLVKYAKHKKEAIKLLEWLSSKKAQNLFADVNMEYPVNPKVSPSELVAKWGKFRKSQMNIAKTGELQAEAIKLMDRASYK